MPETKSNSDIYDPAFVKTVFDRCSGKYIFFSYICSFGFSERWRKQAVANMPKPNKTGLVGYDLMAGTGEIWPHLIKRFGDDTEITAIDISTGMHVKALERLKDNQNYKISFIEDDVLQSRLDSESCDFLISTFGLKTFNDSQHEKLAKLVSKALKPGGVFTFVEASDPKGWFLRPLYLFHLKKVLPIVEKIFLKGAQDFSMIGTYSTDFGNAAAFGNKLRDHGLQVEYKKYFFGCATGVVGRKPA